MKTTRIWVLTLAVGMLFLQAGQAEVPKISFDRYHSYSEVVAYLKAVEKAYPNLARRMSIGKSFLGKDIWVLELSRRDGKNPGDKPGMYIDGGTHGNEVTGTEVCLHTIDYLIRNDGKDPRVTHLLDTRTFYIAPSVNPDSNDLFVSGPLRSLRNNQRPYDDDGDGAFDEDPEEDLDGDGVITMMRKRDPEGTMTTHPEDPRILVRPNREKGEKGTYKVWWTEGVDNDGDGKINEDGKGGVNINRNYPAYWQPEHKQPRAGVYPLSEPEARAIVEFFLAHPNIATVQSYHTSGGFLFQPLAAEKPSVIPEEDRAVFKMIADAYTQATGNEVRRPYRETGPRRGPYGFGIFIDWAYMHFGAYSGTTELWRLPEAYDPEAPGKKPVAKEKDAYARYLKNARAWFRFLDEGLGEVGFVPWKPFQHPTLGEVEIGGWKKFVRSNPPPKFLKEVVEKNTMANIAQAELTPLVVLEDIKVRVIQGGERPRKARCVWEQGAYRVREGERLADRAALLEISAAVRNRGPVRSIAKVMERTSLPFRPNISDLLILEPGPNVRLLSGEPRVRLGSLAAANAPGDRKSATWLVELTGNRGWVKVVSHSQKGGRDERQIFLE